MNKIAVRLAALALCAAMAACSGGSTTTTTTNPGAGGDQETNSWTKPHVLRYSTGEDINSLNPLVSTQSTLAYMSSMTMAWLIKWDSHNLPVPELATEVPTMKNGGVSKDGLTITYHLRKGVKWSDGVPFNADDVVFSIHAVLNPANNVVSRTGWDRIDKIGEPDKYTVVLHLSKPYSPFITTFFSSANANPCILPKHLLAKYPNLNHVAYNSLPVGIGPFKYKEWRRSERVVLVPNPYYFRGVPKLQEVDFEIVPDRNTVMTELQAHELDMYYPVGGAYYYRLKNLKGFTSLLQPAYRFNHLDFNTSRPAVKDPVVRHALLYALDRKTLRDKIGHGIGYLQDQIAPKTAPYYDPKIGFTPFDIDKASKLLDADGWTRGADGVRSKNGVKLNLDVATSSGTPDVDSMIEMIRQTWKQIGVQMTVKHYPAPLMFAAYADNGVVYKGDWDVVFFAWGADPIGDYSLLYMCGQAPPNGQNDLHWCNPKATKAMNDLFTHYDQDQRNKDYAILAEQLEKDVPTIVTTSGEDIFVFNKDLKNFHPNAVTPFDNMMDVDI